MLGDKISRSSAAFSPLFVSNIHLVCHRKCRATSSQLQALRKTNDREEMVERILLHFLNYFHIIFRLLLPPIHEDDPAFEVRWITLSFAHHFLN